MMSAYELTDHLDDLVIKVYNFSLSQITWKTEEEKCSAS